MIRVAILGLGGLGQAAAKLLSFKREMQLVAIADRKGFAYSAEGIDSQQAIASYQQYGSVGHLPKGRLTEPSVKQLLLDHGGDIDGCFLALPNLPNTFMAETASLFCDLGWSGVLVDALKRTSAVEQLVQIGDRLAQSKITYLTGCGATPGLLTAAASLAAQSFVEVHQVKITFGVGIANWQVYRATIREDIAHLPNFSVEQAQAMTDEEVEALLAETNGILHLENMEHADDILLERLGICHRDQVTVGGVVDTRNPKKPISTNMQLTGRTFEGKIATHTFTLGDETSMAANVCGPAFGYLKAGYKLYARGIYGLFTSAEIMPLFVN
jgi:hypothetical protein